MIGPLSVVSGATPTEEIERERALRLAAEREAKFQRARAELLALKLQALAPTVGKARYNVR